MTIRTTRRKKTQIISNITHNTFLALIYKPFAIHSSPIRDNMTLIQTLKCVSFFFLLALFSSPPFFFSFFPTITPNNFKIPHTQLTPLL